VTGRERLFAAVQGLAADRRAVVPVLSLYGARLTHCPLSTYYTDPAAFARGQAAVVGLCQPDALFAPFALTVEGAAFGSEEEFFDRNPPNIRRFAIGAADEVGRLPEPDPDTHPRLLYVRDSVRRVRAACGDDTAIGGICLSPFDSPPLIMGLDAWLAAVMDEGDALRRVLDRTVPFFVRWANALLADGADLIAIPLTFCSPTIVTRSVVERVVLPVLAEAFAAVRGPILFHHGGAPIGPFLSLFGTLPQVVGFAVDHRDDLLAARAAVGPDKVLLGNIDGPTLDRRSQEDIGDACRAVLESMAGDPRFVLATSSADIPIDTPPGNVLALVNSVRPRPASPGPAAGRPPGLVACSVFRPQLEALRAAGALPWPVAYLDSTFHMNPPELGRALDSVVEAHRRDGQRAVIVYGECGGPSEDGSERDAATHVTCRNCCELLLGADRYRQLRREGAFIVLPEWVRRWHEILGLALGMDDDLVRQMMRELHTRLVYLHAPGSSIPSDALQAMSDHLGLPWAVEELPQDRLLDGVRCAVKDDGDRDGA
jgi:uroporphyrinogen decarboxylase